MIEISILKLMTIAGSAFTAGLAIGLTVGYKFSSKTVSTADIVCNTPKNNRHGQIKATRIFANGKATDINCYYLQEKGICQYTNKKCKYL